MQNLSTKERNSPSPNNRRQQPTRLPWWTKIAIHFSPRRQNTNQYHHLGCTQRRPMHGPRHRIILPRYTHAILRIHLCPLLLYSTIGNVPIWLHCQSQRIRLLWNPERYVRLERIQNRCIYTTCSKTCPIWIWTHEIHSCPMAPHGPQNNIHSLRWRLRCHVLLKKRRPPPS